MEPDLDRKVASQLVAIGVELEDGRGLGDRARRRVVVRREGMAADQEDDVVRLQAAADLGGHRRQHALRERVGGGKVGGVVHRLVVDRRAQRLGDPDELLEGSLAGDAVAGDDRGCTSGEQPLRDLVGPRRGAQRSQVGAGGQISRDLLLQHVDRDRDEDRSRRRGRCVQERPAHQLPEVVDVGDLDRLLECAVGNRHQVAAQHRVLDQVLAVLLARGHDHRRAGAARVENHAQPIGQPGCDVQVDERGPAARPGVAVGHRHRRRLVQGELVGQVGSLRQRVHERQLGGAGIAEDVLDALCAQQLDQRPRSLHKGHGTARLGLHARSQGCIQDSRRGSRDRGPHTHSGWPGLEILYTEQSQSGAGARHT